MLHYSNSIQVGDKVLILLPEYVAGKVGVIWGLEKLSGGQMSGRWLIQIDSDDILVSLNQDEFKVLSQSKESHHP
ncbi:hypothetical protein [Chlorogloeopsis sp. ULAP01]|uniref:hypothetical protein n=1 Tax=Chlorogloeopsis sp. ULAP01 TaxID=3056483 RepID=UPI003014FDEE